MGTSLLPARLMETKLPPATAGFWSWGRSGNSASSGLWFCFLLQADWLCSSCRAQFSVPSESLQSLIILDYQSKSTFSPPLWPGSLSPLSPARRNFAGNKDQCPVLVSRLVLALLLCSRQGCTSGQLLCQTDVRCWKDSS